MMTPKFSMTREENIFTAKRNLADYIWKSARLEGLGVTYPDTEAIFKGMRAPSIRVEDIITVNNLKQAWQYVFNHIDESPLSFLSLRGLNEIVCGNSLVIKAGIMGQPKLDLPIESQIKEQMAEINGIEEPTDRAITMMLYLMRKQMFLDGNKRTSMLAGNQIMIANGCGIISVPIEKQPEFTKRLVEFYESGDMEELKLFVYDECIDGIDFRQNEIRDDIPDEGEAPQLMM